MSLYEEKHALYRKYVNELDSFRETPLNLSDQECREICDRYIRTKVSSWHNIFVPASSGKSDLVGFLIIGKGYPEKHPDALRSVAQAYVLPEYRGKGLMTAAMKDYLTRHRGTYSLLILKGNEYAAGFWKRFFEKEGYYETTLWPPVNVDETVMYAFMPR